MKCYKCNKDKDVLFPRVKSIKIDQLCMDNCTVHIELKMMLCRECEPDIDIGPKYWYLPHGC